MGDCMDTDASSLELGGVLVRRLRPSSNATDLKRDIVFNYGSTVFLDGSGQTLRTGSYQLIVGKGDKSASPTKLCIYDLNLVDGMVRP